MAVWTPLYGSAKTYTALTFTVNCQVASFTKPVSAPSTQTYVVYDKPLAIDVTNLVYTQSPACGYTYESVYTWNNLPASVSEAPQYSGKLLVSTSNLDHVATTSVNFVNVIKVPNNGPATDSVFNVNTASDEVSFNIVVNDPCSGTDASAVVFHDTNALVIT